MAKRGFRAVINGVLIFLVGILSAFTAWSIFYIFKEHLNIFQSLWFLPLWILVIFIGKDIVWTLFLLIGKEKHQNLSVGTSNHEKILEEYLKSNPSI